VVNQSPPDEQSRVAPPIRILNIECHPVFSEGLRTIVASQREMALVATATSVDEALVGCRVHRPDVIVMETCVPGGDPLRGLTAIRRESPRARVLVLTGSESHGNARRTMQAGAWAYLLKSVQPCELLRIIREVHAGHRHVPAEVAAQMAEHWGDQELTKRELEVLGLIRDGYRNKQIADRLLIAETTVNFHIKNIVSKLDANDRTHAVMVALRRGMLEI
jgi:DNA-binding NarL/FixJ family response regulator